MHSGFPCEPDRIFEGEIMPSEIWYKMMFMKALDRWKQDPEDKECKEIIDLLIGKIILDVLQENGLCPTKS
jgi:hypothetical protein